MARSVRVCLAAASIVLQLSLGAYARPLGDFGRPEPDVLSNDVFPAVGAARARVMGEPVSSFDRTDEETEMADRIWRFETSGRTKDWLFDAAAELHRTRLAPPSGQAYAPDRYYKWLHRTPYQSAGIRFATIGTDADADLATVPGTFAAICAVELVDDQRRFAAARLPALAPGVLNDLAARLAENGQQIGDFVRALRYRYESYSYALDRFLVETPHDEARAADHSLGALEIEVRYAERGEFCGHQDRPRLGNPHTGPVIPSRFVHGNPPAAVPAGPRAGS